MYVSAAPRVPNWPRIATPWLVCLDLQRDHLVPGRAGYSAANAAVVTACVQVLRVARSDGWRIVHSQRRRVSTAGWSRDLFVAPIEELRPLISEPVFLRHGLSAFADPAFAAELGKARGEDVFLIGFSLADTCTATALAGVDADLSMTLVEDAVGQGEPHEAGDAARLLLKPFVRVISSRNLETRGLELLS
jgi:nicotinamidase-related amidase